MIRVENLSKSFGDNKIFENLSFTIEDGEWVGLYGPSGIGKSTIAKILCKIMSADSGAITGDTDSIQLVYQHPFAALDPRQKIGSALKELVRYKKWDWQDMLKMLHRVGLGEDILEHKPHQISGGEAQRVSIARCLMCNPKLLIMDEATAMLDVTTQANIWELVKSVTAEIGGSILVISHDLELINHLCTKIITLEEKK